MVIDTLQQGKRVRLQVISSSMSPLLRVGDLVEVAPKRFEALAVGDIVVVSGAEMTVTHRLCKIVKQDEQTWLITRGDRVFTYDPPVPAANYIGCATARVRNGRKLDLTAGRGAWLSHHIKKVANFEAELFGGDVNGVEWSAAFVEKGYQIGEKWWRPVRRLIRFTFFTWLCVITSAIR